MAENSKIEWCDHTVNFWHGCTEVSPACEHCYARMQARRFHHRIDGSDLLWGYDSQRLVRVSQASAEAMRYQRRAEKEERRFRVFTNSMSDFFEDRRDLDLPRLESFDLMRRCPDLTFQILTKRPEMAMGLLSRCLIPSYRAERYDLNAWLEAWLAGEYPANVWLGTTVEDQERADQRIPDLLRVPAAVRFLSCEPLLGPVDLTTIKHAASPGYFGDCLQWYHRPNGVGSWPGLNWVICGGETGPNARPMHPDWVRILRDQCKDAGVPFLFKQWGGKAKAGRLLDDELHDEYPGVRA